jgi:hypothetical protein
MFGYDELRSAGAVKQNPTMCPVLGCSTQVNRMTRGILRSLDDYLQKGGTGGEKFEQYFCAKHGVYITPTTFIYKDLWDNVVRHDSLERELLAEIMKVKRVKAQLHHDNSEDAATWNVFRFLERSELLPGFLTQLRGLPVTRPEAMYWSYCPSEEGVWSEVARARDALGERPQRASEPDLILKSDGALFLIEAKLSAPSADDFDTGHTAEEKAERVERYSKGRQYLSRPVEDVMDAGYFQLMRFWLVGSWIAERLGWDFLLVNLVLSRNAEGIQEGFEACIARNRGRRFLVASWEDVYEYVAGAASGGAERETIMSYFKNKTLGYERVFAVSWRNGASVKDGSVARDGPGGY